MLRPPQLRVDGHHVVLDPVDPTTMARFYAASEDPRIDWRLGIVSAARTVAEQRYLYNGYRAHKPGFALAANPAWHRPDGQGIGSRHMVQPDGHSYALDLHLHAALGWPTAHKVFKEYGLRFSVHNENWHCQALMKFVDNRPDYWPVTPKWAPDEERWLARIKDAAPTAAGWAKLAAFKAACRKTTVRKGDAGVTVQFLQRALNHADTSPDEKRWPRLEEDGLFGDLTAHAVSVFEADEGLTVDGIAGPKVWDALLG